MECSRAASHFCASFGAKNNVPSRFLDSEHHNDIQFAARKILVDVILDGPAAKLLVDLRLQPDPGVLCHVEKLDRHKANNTQQRDGHYRHRNGDTRLRIQENWH